MEGKGFYNDSEEGKRAVVSEFDLTSQRIETYCNKELKWDDNPNNGLLINTSKIELNSIERYLVKKGYYWEINKVKDTEWYKQRLNKYIQASPNETDINVDKVINAWIYNDGYSIIKIRENENSNREVLINKRDNIVVDTECEGYWTYLLAMMKYMPPNKLEEFISYHVNKNRNDTKYLKHFITAVKSNQINLLSDRFIECVLDILASIDGPITKFKPKNYEKDKVYIKNLTYQETIDFFKEALKPITYQHRLVFLSNNEIENFCLSIFSFLDEDLVSESIKNRKVDFKYKEYILFVFYKFKMRSERGGSMQQYVTLLKKSFDCFPGSVLTYSGYCSKLFKDMIKAVEIGDFDSFEKTLRSNKEKKTKKTVKNLRRF